VLKENKMMDNTEVVTHNGKCRETGNAGHTRQKKTKAKTKKPNTMCVLYYITTVD
jgi:hypothetical protein